MRGSRMYCQRGSNFDNDFLGGGGVANGMQIQLLACHYRPVSETQVKRRFAGVPMMALKWRFDGRPMMTQHWMLAR